MTKISIIILMIDTRALVSLYIKDGKEKMISYVESSFAKKKGKRSSNQEEGCQVNPSVYNFITVKPYQHTFDYFSQEMLNSLEGKTRSSNMFKDEEDQDVKDINSFKILYNKYLVAPPVDYSKKELQLLSKSVDIKAGERIFKNELENSEINESIQKLGRTIEQSKLNLREASKELYKKVEFDILAGRTSINHYEYCNQVRQSIQNTASSVFRISPSLIQESQEPENICQQNIVYTIRRWLNELLQALKIKDLMNSPSIMVEWGNNLLLAEKHQLFAQQVSGKVLFNVQQSINKLKQVTSPLDFARQFHLRQKKYGVTNHNPNNFPQITPRQKGKTEKVSLLAFAERQATRGSNIAEDQYNKMANRINNLKRLKSPENNIEQAHPKSKGREISQNKQQSKFFNQYAGMRKKLTPLKQENIDSFEYKKPSKSNISSQISNRMVNREQKASPKLPRAKIELKFPIKIGHFEMYSPDESCLCYQAEEINLKELPLVFIKDRLKFGQNKVKIEYPCKPKSNVTDIVCKCLQILNSLGAIVSCEEQSSYKATHDIDSSEILAVSWLVERPVKEIVKLYGEYFSSCPTKK